MNATAIVEPINKIVEECAGKIFLGRFSVCSFDQVDEQKETQSKGNKPGKAAQMIENEGCGFLQCILDSHMDESPGQYEVTISRSGFQCAVPRNIKVIIPQLDARPEESA